MVIALAARMNRLPDEIREMDFEDMLALAEHFHRESEEMKAASKQQGSGSAPGKGGGQRTESIK